MTYRTYRRFWAVLLIGGGLLGIGNLAFGLMTGAAAPPLWLLVLAAGIFALSGVAGVGLWRSLRWGITLAAALFAAQLFLVDIPAVGYRFWTGACVPLILEWDAQGGFSLGINAWLDSTLELRLFTAGAAEARYVLGLNLLSVLALIHLLPGVRHDGDITPEERSEMYHRPDTGKEPKPRIRPYG